jgi:SAM-dependent methyltransferase
MLFGQLTVEELNRIANDVRERRGWDFSSLQAEKDLVPWDYLKVATRFLRPSSQVLDLGTGGGEKLIGLAPSFGGGLGIDGSQEMIRVARENLPPRLACKLRFEVMRAEALDVQDEDFDVVLNRHCPVFAEQIVRVLQPDGYFVTQQVGARNQASIFEAFGWGSNGEFVSDYHRERGEQPPSDLDSLGAEFERLGCIIAARGEYDARFWIKDVSSLVFQLKAAPYPEEFDPARHWRQVNHLLAQSVSPRGIETNEHRWLLVVRKP